MSTFILIPGAGGVAWYWHRVVPLLEDAGHDATAVDLPGDDERAGLSDYARIVLELIGERDDVVLVSQSLGGFTAAIVAASRPLAEARLRQRDDSRAGRTPRRVVGQHRLASGTPAGRRA